MCVSFCLSSAVKGKGSLFFAVFCMFLPVVLNYLPSPLAGYRQGQLGDVAEALVSVRHANCEMVSTIQVRYRCTKKVAKFGAANFLD